MNLFLIPFAGPLIVLSNGTLAVIYMALSFFLFNHIRIGNVTKPEAFIGITPPQSYKESQDYVVPDAFTHGTSEQRVYWFKKGFESGDILKGDAFKDANIDL